MPRREGEKKQKTSEGEKKKTHYFFGRKRGRRGEGGVFLFFVAVFAVFGKWLDWVRLVSHVLAVDW